MRKDSNESILNTRTVSDEIHSVKSEHDPIFLRLNSLLAELDASKRVALSKKLRREKKSQFSGVADAILSLVKSLTEKPTAATIATLFTSLGYTKDNDALICMLRNIFDFQASNSINFTPTYILKICEDYSVDKLLRVLLQDIKENYNQYKTEGFDSLISVIKKWWNKLDKAKNGFVAIEEVCRFFIEIQCIDNMADGRRMFSRLTQFITFRQFFGIFSKSLFKYLITNLKEIANQKDFKCLPADISISAIRRKNVISELIGENDKITAMVECDNY